MPRDFHDYKSIMLRVKWMFKIELPSYIERPGLTRKQCYIKWNRVVQFPANFFFKKEKKNRKFERVPSANW